MKQHNKGNQEDEGRENVPSGRQASEQPEHTGNADAAPSSLHQGQGPDFQTQDRTAREQNEGIQNLNKVGYEQSGTEQQGNSPKENAYENPDRADEDVEKELPSREKEEKPYIGDNPAETKRQSPKMENE